MNVGLRGLMVRGASALLCVFASVSAAVAASHDSRELTRGEQRRFMPLVCRHATYDAALKERRCASLIGYPSGSGDVGGFQLTAVAYGSFTKTGTDQAYVSYFTMFESHANNFGGGVLFQRSSGQWKLVRWYPGGQMDECVAVPGRGLQRMLCRSGYLSEGIVTSAVFVRTVPDSNRAGALAGGSVALINIEDDRGMSTFLRPSASESKCGRRADYHPSVVIVETLKRSARPGYFAESDATYLTPREQYDACRGRQWNKIKGVKMEIRYALRGGTVTFDSPIPIKEREN